MRVSFVPLLRKSAGLLAAAMACTALPLNAQTPSPPGISLAPLSAKLGMLSERATYLELPDRRLFEETHDALLTLQRTLERTGRELPDEYRQLIKGYEEALPTAQDLSNAGRTAEVQGRVSALKADLTLKNRYLASGLGAAPFSKELLVLVEVRTRTLGKPVGGYEVSASPVAVPASWKPLPFSSTTNDARRKLAPGIYTFTFRRNGQVVQKAVDVGEDGLPTQTVWQDVAQ